jgi:glycogen operon protein
VNFALFSQHATGVELCLFDLPSLSSRSRGAPPERMRIAMTEQTDNVWHVYLPDARPGLLYGYRVYGPHDPQHGQRFNPHKLLVDPYAKAIAGSLRWHDAVFGYKVGNPHEDLAADKRDSAPYMPRSVVIDPSFDWGDDRPPATPLHRSVICELHVKGFTRLHPAVPKQLRGTYSGLAQPEVIEYLQSLGISAVELLPVHQHVDDRALVQRGLCNYWGYNTLGYFAPDTAYSSAGSCGEQVCEFKSMVKALHAAGIEVILDVVYNHSAEGNHLGPTLSLKGIDNLVYYRQPAGVPRYYLDYTGCGNSLSVLHPRTLQLIMDSLRYWVLEMHVDGFRFDLATTLARGLHDSDRLSTFFDIIHQDPVLSQVKLIAEPWDIGPGGYQVGNFPVLWAEWNGKYRDAVRRFWKGEPVPLSEMAYRLTGSSDLYRHNGRRPYASINFVTAHDGFTLRDLVSYNRKHNAANGEDNRDGENHNNSFNHGVEGPSANQAIVELRARQQRNFLAMLLLSQGVPMLLAGDERSRTQGGNNNAYCQDNAIGWVDWSFDDVARTQLEWTRRLIRLRREHPALHRRRFFQDRSIHGRRVREVEWFGPDGRELSEAAWFEATVGPLGMLLNGQEMDEIDEQGQQLHDDILLLLLNPGPKVLRFILPTVPGGSTWEPLLDSSKPDVEILPSVRHGAAYRMLGRSLALLRLVADQRRSP